MAVVYAALFTLGILLHPTQHVEKTYINPAYDLLVLKGAQGVDR